MKKILSVALFLIPLIALANRVVPLPTEGLQIIPLAQMDMPEDLKQDILKGKAEEKLKGYQEKDSKYVQFLLNLKRNAPKEISSYKDNHNPLDTHLKSNLSDIQLVFPFNNITWIKSENILGFAAAGSYVKNQPNYPNGGWTGIVVFFIDSRLGSCSYSFFNLKASNGAILLAKETTEYLVHKKPSSRTIEGSYNSGFAYSLNWYENGAMNELSCANINFDKQIMAKMITLANRIDAH
jgi:hypothetical protein